ncbi:MAG: hypothetical protein KC544_07975 [Gemmatimonadetes bacterium]|nr:hypothetical protein [Gemmatimonadota bacterium]MCB9519188.1 hypothetical protein [Gemmatimonadales bacterium]
MRPDRVPFLMTRISLFVLLLLWYHPTATAQSACLPPFTSPAITQPAASVLLYTAALERAHRAHSIVTTLDTNSNVMLAMRQAAAEARCAESLTTMVDENADSLLRGAVQVAGAVFGIIATGIDGMRESLIRQIDAGSVSAREADLEASAVELVQSGWKGLMTPTIVLVSVLRNAGGGDCAEGVSAEQRPELLAELRSQVGGDLSESDARKSFPMLSLYAIQSCLRGNK